MALTTEDREKIAKAAKEAGVNIRFIGTNRTLIDGDIFYGDHQAKKKLKGS